MAIDWTKPVEVVDKNGPFAYRLYSPEHIYSLDRGGALVVWRSEEGQLYAMFSACGTIPSGVYTVRNVPPAKREYWINLYRSSNNSRITAGQTLYPSEALAEKDAGMGCCGTVKVYEEEEPKGERT